EQEANHLRQNGKDVRDERLTDSHDRKEEDASDYEGDLAERLHEREEECTYLLKCWHNLRLEQPHQFRHRRHELTHDCVLDLVPALEQVAEKFLPDLLQDGEHHR